MDFSFSQEQLELKKKVIEFAIKELNGDTRLRDKENAFSRQLWKKCADFGILGMPFPKEFGGLEYDILTSLMIMEGLGYACKDNGLIFSINGQMWTVQMPIMRFGTEIQKRKYLPRLCRGDWIGANGITEPESGSDSFSLRTSAKLDGSYYIITGTKTLVTNAPIADIFVIYANTDKAKGFLGITAFLVEKSFSGLEVGRDIEKMGLKTSPMAQIMLNECKVPVENRLGQEGQGVPIFNDSIEWERSCMLASDIGVMERQLEECINYAKMRRQFGRPIGKFQSVANRIVDMKLRLETARLLLYKVAWLKENQKRAVMEAAMVKLYLSEAFVKSCLDAIQIHGGYGYMTEYEIERNLRDAVGSTLYSGTSEIQRNIIARYLGL